MKKYALLLNPGHNRAYFEETSRLSVSETSIALSKLSTQCGEPVNETIGGVKYLTFEALEPLSARDLEVVSALSFLFAIFEFEDGLFRPLQKKDKHFIDESISSMLKYSGKTNESFTRLMINLASLSCESGKGELSLLDPLAGKGTSLFEGLIRGYNVSGIEIGDKVSAECFQYLKRFLETERYKYTQKTERISGENKSFTAVKYSAEIARGKEEMKTAPKRFELVAGDSVHADSYYRKDSFDMIVADLPYGVQHSNVTGESQSSFTRNPVKLLDSCLPLWTKLLKKGGTAAFAWNTFVLKRAFVAQLLEKNGLKVFDTPEYLSFEHRVDQAIRRDVIVAIKP